MSDSERTPQGSARVNSERFETELAAVWYAANYYYESSYRRGGEYIGVVFLDADGKYGITVRGDGGFAGSKVRIHDVPRGTAPMAVWHTHIPCTAGETDAIVKILLCLATTLDAGWDTFSSEDRKLSDDASKWSVPAYGRRFPIYLVTATQIKRYRGEKYPEMVWRKDPPSRMRSMFR